MPMPDSMPLRLFLDTGVIIDGCTSSWSPSKAVLILVSQYPKRYTIVLAAEVEGELLLALDRKVLQVKKSLTRRGVAGADMTAQGIKDGAVEWLTRVRLERQPACSQMEIERHKPHILPALHHENDVPPVVAAMNSSSDWVISNNDRHWNAELAARTGLRIATAYTFLEQLSLGHVIPRPP